MRLLPGPAKNNDHIQSKARFIRNACVCVDVNVWHYVIGGQMYRMGPYPFAVFAFASQL